MMNTSLYRDYFLIELSGQPTHLISASAWFIDVAAKKALHTRIAVNDVNT